MAEVDAEFKLSSASGEFGEDECCESTTEVSKTGTKRTQSKIGLEDTCINDNESLLVAMRLLSKNAYVGNPFEVSNGEVCAWKSGVYQSDQEWSYFDSLYF